MLDYNKFRNDTLIAEKSISLYDLLCNYNGVCNNLELTIDLMKEVQVRNNNTNNTNNSSNSNNSNNRNNSNNSNSDNVSSSSSGNLVKVKVGELITILHGFQIDMSQVLNPSREASASANNHQGTFNNLIIRIILIHVIIYK